MASWLRHRASTLGSRQPRCGTGNASYLCRAARCCCWRRRGGGGIFIPTGGVDPPSFGGDDRLGEPVQRNALPVGLGAWLESLGATGARRQLLPPSAATAPRSWRTIPAAKLR